MGQLVAEIVKHVYSPDGAQADLDIVEPNGDRHRVRCLCRGAETELGEVGNGENVAYLNRRYGSQEVCSVARIATLGP